MMPQNDERDLVIDLGVLIAEPAAVVLGVLGLSALVLGVVNVVVAASDQSAAFVSLPVKLL